MGFRSSLITLCTATLVVASGCGDDTPMPPHQGTNNPSTGQDSGTAGDGDFGSGDGDFGSGDGDFGSGDGDFGSGDGDFGSGDGDFAPGDGDFVPGDGDGVIGDGDGDNSFIRGEAPTVESASKVGPYVVKSYTEAEGLRNGPDYADATLWYPTDAEAPFAFAAVVPGFVSVQGQIATWGSFLASHGIVTITIGTNGLGDTPDLRAKALLDALKTVAEENGRSGSPLEGKLDVNRQAVMGWSMGGGGALLAAERTPSLKAAISLAGWNPGYDYSKVKVPSLLFAAQSDGLAAGHSQGFYDTIPATTPKLLWESSNFTPFFGGHDTFNAPATLEGAVGRYGLSWLKLFLEGDTRYQQFLEQEPPTKTDYRISL
jgi:dienelactone hydrolase